jgi:predicted lipoprotein with Yx(FWY)xxD motif
MSPSRIAAVLMSLFAVVLIASGCGGGSSSNSTSNASASAANGGDTVSGSEVSGLGTVLVDSEGLTVYMFAKDEGTTSSCYGACAEGWPPVIATGKSNAGEGAISSQLGTTKRKDGSMQVTYAGHPLYTFAGDTAPGEANGNESTAFGGKWSAMDEAGEAVAGTAEAPEEETSESSGGGYGY